MNRKLAATYFVGYTADRVVTHDDGFDLHFPQGCITSHGGGPVPTWAKGSTLRSVDYSDDASVTTLSFGNGVVVLTPDEYSVTHPSCGTIFPERDADDEDSLPPDPSPERVVDGPEAA